MAAKRKYARVGDEAKAYECSKKSCKWQGLYEEKQKKQMGYSICEMVCPICGHNEFYGLLELPSKILNKKK